MHSILKTAHLCLSKPSMINFNISLTVTSLQYARHVELCVSFAIVTLALLGDSEARLLCREDL